MLLIVGTLNIVYGIGAFLVTLGAPPLLRSSGDLRLRLATPDAQIKTSDVLREAVGNDRLPISMFQMDVDSD